jgi:hypothetical protein
MNDWLSAVTLMDIVKWVNGVFAVRISDNILDPEDWSIHTITMKDGVVVRCQKIYDGAYPLDMLGWKLGKLHTWLQYDGTGRPEEEYHEIKVIETF